MSLVNANSPDTSQMPSTTNEEEQEVEEVDKDTSVDIITVGEEGSQVLEPHIGVNMEDNKVELGATIVIPCIDPQT